MMPAKRGDRVALVRNGVLAALCWYATWGAGRPAYGQPALAPAEDKVTPKAWIQQYLRVEFPNSARHFVLYYRSGYEDVVLFSFDIAKDDLQRLMDGRGAFPSYGDLAKGGSPVPERIVRDSGSQDFAQKVAAMPNALSATKGRTAPAGPLAVQLWTTEASPGRWAVCVSIITDKPADTAAAYGGFKMPAGSQETYDYVIIDSRLEWTYDTSIWQRWSLDETGYRELMQTVNASSDVVRVPGDAGRLAGRLDARGLAPGVPWWKPSEMEQRHAGGSEPLAGFRHEASGVTSTLVTGRADGLFCCYSYTQRQILASDPPDAMWRVLGLQLPASAFDAHYESASSMAGIVSWMRFDLPLRDFVACLAQTPTLPAYAEFAAAPGAKDHLHTAYQAGAPEWWFPQELNQGIYARRINSTKESHDVSLGLGRLPGENIRVYIGEFSAW